MTLRIVFFGTGTFAAPVFRALADCPHQLVGLVTQPDRVGRGHHQHVNPLKEFALERGMEVLQPVSIKTPEALCALQALQPDLAVVAAYGQILPESVLNAPRLGCINVHASLLPRYRGATPIHAAIAQGDEETGVTIIGLEPGLDAGPMLGQAKTAIGLEETTGQLEVRLAQLAVPLTLRVVDELASGTSRGIPQDPALVTRAGKFSKTHGLIDWSRSAAQVGWHIRAMQPWPGPYTYIHRAGKPAVRMQVLGGQARFGGTALSAPGTVSVTSSGEVEVQTGDGAYLLTLVQPDGKKALSAGDALNGRVLQPGDLLGSEPTV